MKFSCSYLTLSPMLSSSHDAEITISEIDPCWLTNLSDQGISVGSSFSPIQWTTSVNLYSFSGLTWQLMSPVALAIVPQYSSKEFQI